jgi:integrase
MIEALRIPANYLVNNEKINKAVLLTPKELQLMLHRAEKLRDKALLILLYETGARPQEIRDLRWRDVNWEAKEVHLYSKKTKGDRDLPLKESLKHLRRWKSEWVYPDPRDQDYIFPSLVGSRPDRTKPVSVTYINRIIKGLARKAEITRPINTYLLRHTRLTEIRKLGIQGVEFNQFAGHRPGSRQESVYVHLDNDDMKRSILEKVYKLGEEEQQTKNHEERVERLERQLRRVLTYLKQSEDVLQVTDGELATMR